MKYQICFFKVLCHENYKSIQSRYSLNYSSDAPLNPIAIIVEVELEIQFKVGISGYANLQTMSTDKWTTSKSTQLSTKVWVKLLLLLEKALKLNFEAL